MNKPLPQVALPLERKLIASCQSAEGDAFRDAGIMARFAVAAVEGGAAGIRANGPADIRSIRAAVAVPIIGIHKVMQADGRILITPSFEAARALVEAGASMIALDCTGRGQRYGALDRLRRIRSELGVPVLADIATVEEAAAADRAGADFVLSTMRGYTPETASSEAFEPEFITALTRAVTAPVVAEGRILSPRQAVAAIEAGAFAVVVGGAITRPAQIARRFAAALEAFKPGPDVWYIGIDLGATNTKAGIVDRDGRFTAEFTRPTPQTGGRNPLLDHLVETAQRSLAAAGSRELPIAAIGLATAGWVDPATGVIVHATENLPGWSGTEVAGKMREATGLPVAVENDANALAIAEKHFGVARSARNFVCITLGTGVGGGCYVGGRLNRGARFFANALGHITIEPDGLPCTCGQRGCLEAYASAAALLRYAGGTYSSGEKVIRAAREGDAAARQAIVTYASYLARGCASIIHMLDPEMLVFSGGLAQDNPELLKYVARELSTRVLMWSQRQLQLYISPLGYYSGVLGAAAFAMEIARRSELRESAIDLAAAIV